MRDFDLRVFLIPPHNEIFRGLSHPWWVGTLPDCINHICPARETVSQTHKWPKKDQMSPSLNNHLYKKKRKILIIGKDIYRK